MHPQNARPSVTWGAESSSEGILEFRFDKNRKNVLERKSDLCVNEEYSWKESLLRNWNLETAVVLGWLISSLYTLIIVGSLITMTALGDAFLVCFFSLLHCVNRLSHARLANMFTFGDQREHLWETDFMLFCQLRKVWIKFLGNILLNALGEWNELLSAGHLVIKCDCSSCMDLKLQGRPSSWSKNEPRQALISLHFST